MSEHVDNLLRAFEATIRQMDRLRATQPVVDVTQRSYLTEAGLIEHGDRPGGIVANHFLVDPELGFVIQPYVQDSKGKGPLDKGLFANAQDFIDKVGNRLTPMETPTRPAV